MLVEILKAILFGVVEGITEWLPISSTGHLILLDNILTLNISADFYELFQVVIQLGAIVAVIVLFFHKLNPFSPYKRTVQKERTGQLWNRVIVAVLPSAVLGVFLDDWLDTYLYNSPVVAAMLILYGVIFLLVEKRRAHHYFYITDISEIDFPTAIGIGVFQCLSLIPGTSRSGATILGALLLGVNRSTGAEFSFFLAIPTMLGASGLKLAKFLESGVCATGTEIAVLITGCLVSFLVSLVVIRGLMDYVQKHSFAPFGIYRIILGFVVLLYFWL